MAKSNSNTLPVLVRQEKRASDRAAVGILDFPVENFLVQLEVVQINCPVEREHDHLGSLESILIIYIIQNGI